MASGQLGFGFAAPSNLMNVSAFVAKGAVSSKPARRGKCRVVAFRQQPRAQTWSDPAVTREYIDFLEGKGGQPQSEDGPSTIVGAGGRLGALFASAGEGEDLLVTRGKSIPEDSPGPIYVCTPASEIEKVILETPESRREDLIFMQNGYLETVLRRHGCDDNTRANIYFAVPGAGKKPFGGVTPSNPNGLTNVTGKWAEAFQERLDKVNVKCNVLFERDYRRSNFEKLIWICAFNLIGSVHGQITMGQVADKHTDEVQDLVLELGKMMRFTLTVGMGSDIEKRLVEYARSVKDFPTAIKEFEWRNGFFYRYSKLATSRGLDDQTPMHTGYLEDGKKMGLIDW
jgi:hypothetical protein